MNLSTKTFLLLSALLGFAGSASAVSLSHDHTGQVLIYPYYTTNAGQQSTLTLTNQTPRSKAVKLMIREGVFGEAAYVLNVYLAPYDTWTGTLGQLGDSPVLLSNDISCTVPSLHAATLPSLPDGRHYMRPDSAALSSGAVPNEGYIVAIEMGEVSGNSATLSGVQITAPQCDKLTAAWHSGGYWQTDPNTDISAPNGGLSGTMTIINPATGTVFRGNATALRHFRVTPMNTAGDSAHPDLGDALSDASTGVASAEIHLGDTTIQSNYPASRAVDAVTAVLMTQQLATSADFRYNIGARTALVLTMPTKRFYATDTDHPVPPFGRDKLLERSAQGTLCPLINIEGRRRDGAHMWLVELTEPFQHTQPTAKEVPKPCYATSVLGLWPNRDTSVLHSQLRTMTHYPLGVGFIHLFLNYYAAGCTGSPSYCKAHPDAWKDSAAHAHINVMRPDLAGRQYFGLPVVGFSATGYINANVGDTGVRRNFTFTSTFGRSRVCAQSDAVGSCH